ncbi:hypothetical protein Tco_0965284 [Tanacetum coccineum]
MEKLKQLAIHSKSELLSEQVLLFVTDAVKNKVELIEEIKQLNGRAVDSDYIEFVRILRGEDLDKAKSIMKLINETQNHNREKYVFIAKVELDRK